MSALVTVTHVWLHHSIKVMHCGININHSLHVPESHSPQT